MVQLRSSSRVTTDGAEYAPRPRLWRSYLVFILLIVIIIGVLGTRGADTPDVPTRTIAEF